MGSINKPTCIAVYSFKLVVPLSCLPANSDVVVSPKKIKTLIRRWLKTRRRHAGYLQRQRLPTAAKKTCYLLPCDSSHFLFQTIRYFPICSGVPPIMSIVRIFFEVFTSIVQISSSINPEFLSCLTLLSVS